MTSEVNGMAKMEIRRDVPTNYIQVWAKLANLQITFFKNHVPNHCTSNSYEISEKLKVFGRQVDAPDRFFGLSFPVCGIAVITVTA